MDLKTENFFTTKRNKLWISIEKFQVNLTTLEKSIFSFIHDHSSLKLKWESWQNTTQTTQTSVTRMPLRYRLPKTNIVSKNLVIVNICAHYDGT